jgi:hypothetical protein
MATRCANRSFGVARSAFDLLELDTVDSLVRCSCRCVAEDPKSSFRRGPNPWICLCLPPLPEPHPDSFLFCSMPTPDMRQWIVQFGG